MGRDVDMAVGGEEANSETGKGGLVGQKRLMISGACSTSVARCAGSGGPDLLHLKLETLEWGAGLQQLEIVEPLGLTVGWPHFHSLFAGNQQPAKPVTVGLANGHLAAQGRESAGAGSGASDGWADPSGTAKIGKIPMISLKTDRLVHPLRRFGAVPLAREVLDEVLSPYRRPNDKVSEWLREGALQPLRRGLYLTGAPLRSTPACLPLVANHLYGPSYVSLDYALALHGMIPEGVAEVTSATVKPSRNFTNSLGRFSYSHLPLRFYAIGQQLGEGPAGERFLLASPTKALCDRLVLSRELPPLSRSAMRDWLLRDLRLDTDLLCDLSLDELRLCLSAGFKQRYLRTLLRVIEMMQQDQG
jgi:hypothetical protein